MSYNRRGNSRYVYGSTVRKLDSMPARQPERRREEERRERAARKNAKARKKINLLSLGMVVAAILASMYLCISYVKVYSDVNSTRREIASLERQIDKIKASNEIAYAEIDSSIDLGYVYKKATKKLGMVPAKGDQVYQYDNKKSDRVIQHNDIPH